MAARECAKSRPLTAVSSVAHRLPQRHRHEGNAGHGHNAVNDPVYDESCLRGVVHALWRCQALIVDGLQGRCTGPHDALSCCDRGLLFGGNAMQCLARENASTPDEDPRPRSTVVGSYTSGDASGPGIQHLLTPGAVVAIAHTKQGVHLQLPHGKDAFS